MLGTAMNHLLLIGNPNCGKTTLFNALTGDNQRVGNWPGVTVEQKTGQVVVAGETMQLTDLPGIYSLTNADGLSQDEQITADAIISLESECIINVVDACHLERHLYLTSQILELGKPVILVVNMMDVAAARGINIDTAVMAERLGCPVIALQAHKQIGLDALHKALLAPLKASPIWQLPLMADVQALLATMEQQLLDNTGCPSLAYYQARRIAEGGCCTPSMPHELLNSAAIADLDIVLADARYQSIHQLIKATLSTRSDTSEHLTAKLDRIVLHRFFAIPIFFAMMYCMFLFAINIGGAFQDFFDISTDTVFVQGSAWLLQQMHAPNWLIALIANGLGKGINTTLTFIPVIAAMFFFLALLETSGYMARAAFVVDKAMRAMGLPGKSFVPMIVGFGCNVPAIMAARTLDSERDRLLTVMMSPFMSCSARLAIYAVFVAAFFPTGGQNVVFSLYIIGILMAVFTGFLLRKTMLQGNSSPLILELPVYHRPTLSRLLKETMLRLKFFVLRAGKLIIPVCIILGGLNAITLAGGLSVAEANAQSLLSACAQWLTPLFSPMGIHQDNWPATVGLLTGTLAKEVVVGTLNSLYAQADELSTIAHAHFDLWSGLNAALWSVPQNLAQLGSALWNPVLASAAENDVSQSVYGVMAQRFDGQVGAYAYLLFVLLYVPCVSTMAVIRQEASKRLMWLSVIWSFMVAYAAAVIFYQAATFMAHPKQSIMWIAAIIAVLVGSILWFYFSEKKQEQAHAVTTS